jgi:hypothetical protein
MICLVCVHTCRDRNTILLPHIPCQNHGTLKKLADTMQRGLEIRFFQGGKPLVLFFLR